MLIKCPCTIVNDEFEPVGDCTSQIEIMTVEDVAAANEAGWRLVAGVVPICPGCAAWNEAHL